jgi:uncharacterized protein (DUF3084 family)
MDYKQELEQIEETISENKEKLIRLQEKEKQLKEEKDTIMAELKELGLTPEILEEEITKLEKEIKEGIEKAEKILNNTSSEEEPEPLGDD